MSEQVEHQGSRVVVLVVQSDERSVYYQKLEVVAAYDPCLDPVLLLTNPPTEVFGAAKVGVLCS